MVTWAGEKKNGVHPYHVNKDGVYAETNSHWSLLPHVGFNLFDGDFSHESKSTFGFPSLGLGAEYTFTPYWSIGVDYTFDLYHVKGKPGANNADTLLHGYNHRLGLYVGLDLVNMVHQRAKRKPVMVQLLGGGGYGLYRNTAMYHDDAKDPTHTHGNTLYYRNADNQIGRPDYMTKYSGSVYVMGGLNVEFNINRSLALGARATYSIYFSDYIDGRGYEENRSGSSLHNDGIADFTIALRYKIDAQKRNHMCNVAGDGSYIAPHLNPVHDTVIIERHDSIIVRETKVVYEAAPAAPAAQVASAAPVVQEAQPTHSTHHTASTRTETVAPVQQQTYYIYFDNGGTALNNDGLITIQQVAERLEENDELYAVVIGYCDNTGSDKVNYVLADKRAAVVVDELLQEYGLPSDHLYGAGMGKLVGKRSTSAYSPNRRAAIKLVDKETFELLKAEMDDRTMLRADEVLKTMPLSETARREKVNSFKDRKSEQVKVDKHTTLAKLARQYYNNTYAWVYIYLANRDKIAKPNELPSGEALNIPEITEEETKITKEECLALYQTAPRVP